MGEISNSGNMHPAPLWLNAAYMESILRSSKQDNGLRVMNLLIKPATAKGENYASVMTRVKIDYLSSGAQNSETEYYIVKTTYENDPHISKIFAAYEVMSTEMTMYEQVMPQLSALLLEIGDAEKLFAKTLHVDYENAAIIFEDLAVSQYVLADRLAGLDMTHAQMSLKKLAKMHATAAVLNERQPGLLTKLDHGIMNRHTTGFAPLFENLVGVAAEFAGECPELGPKYRQKLLRLQQRVVEYSTRAYDPQPGQFNTLNHGDFWVNNMMLRYDARQQPLDIVLIDFQFCNWSSPAVDLHYFFGTSLQPELLYHQQDALVQYYHQVLTETLRALKFGGQVPTLRQLVLQLEAGRFLAVTSLLVCRAILTNDKTEDADFNGLLLDDERGRNFRKLIYTNPKLQESLKRLLPVFNRIGLLDVTD